MPNSLAVVGVILVVVMCLIAYQPIQNQLNSEAFLSLSFGFAFSKIFPVLLTVFGVMFSLAILYVSSQNVVTK